MPDVQPRSPAPGRILALHGYGMNGAWMQQWLAPYAQRLGDRAVLVCADGPMEVPPAEVRAMLARFGMALPKARIAPAMNRCWYRASDDTPPRYDGLEQSLAWLERFCAEHGPFDGLFGWSQGATMAALMAAAQQQGVGRFGIRWLVLGGGFMPAADALQPWFSAPLAFPSLHVVGRRDAVLLRRRAQALHGAFRAAEWLDTPLGHRLPSVRQAGLVCRISDWMAARLEDRVRPQPRS